MPRSSRTAATGTATDPARIMPRPESCGCDDRIPAPDGSESIQTRHLIIPWTVSRTSSRASVWRNGDSRGRTFTGVQGDAGPGGNPYRDHALHRTACGASGGTHFGKAGEGENSKEGKFQGPDNPSGSFRSGRTGQECSISDNRQGKHPEDARIATFTRSPAELDGTIRFSSPAATIPHTSSTILP